MYKKMYKSKKEYMSRQDQCRKPQVDLHFNKNRKWYMDLLHILLLLNLQEECSSQFRKNKRVRNRKKDQNQNQKKDHILPQFMKNKNLLQDRGREIKSPRKGVKKNRSIENRIFQEKEMMKSLKRK